MKKHNFSAGPCILPQEVLQKASEAILNFNDDALSLIEISHRSASFVSVMEKGRQLALELLGLENKGYKALFLQGGASLEFLMVAYNLLEKKAAYLNTGTWADKAIKEAKAFGEVVEVGSSKDSGFSYIPKGYSLPEDIDYFHCTSNNNENISKHQCTLSLRHEFRYFFTSIRFREIRFNLCGSTEKYGTCRSHLDHY